MLIFGGVSSPAPAVVSQQSAFSKGNPLNPVYLVVPWNWRMVCKQLVAPI